MPEGMIKTRKRLLADEASPPSHYIDVVNAPWETSKFPGIEHKVLYSDPNTGMATLLFRLAPGAVVPLHEHTVWRPAGNTHVAHAPNGALLLGVFMSPNHFAEGQKFFTEENPG
jgi:hypothetical protein